MKSGLRNRINRWLGDGKPWRKIRHALGLDRFPPLVRRLIVGVLGGTLLLAGIAMVVLPGPSVSWTS